MLLAEPRGARLWDPWGEALPLTAWSSTVSKPASGTSLRAETVAVNRPQFRVQSEGVGKFLSLSPVCRIGQSQLGPCDRVLHLGLHPPLSLLLHLLRAQAKLHRVFYIHKL